VRTGKTTAALAEAQAEAGAAGLPLLILDSLGSSTFDHLRATFDVKTARAACVRVFRQGRHTLWVPKDPEEVEALAAVAFDMGHDGRSCVMLIDETSPWFSAMYRPRNLTLLVRAHRHCRISIFLTTQYLGDLSPAYLQCVERHRIFRTSSPRALQRIRDTFPGVDVRKVASLPVGRHVDFPA
jgi:hypothetical protein